MIDVDYIILAARNWLTLNMLPKGSVHSSQLPACCNKEGENMKARSAFLAFLTVVAIDAPVVAQEPERKVQSPGTPGGARVLNLSKVPAVIDEPGSYVLDRTWDLESSVPGRVLLTINADGVALDLKGFAINYCAPYEGGTGVHIRGSFVTLRNGELDVCGVAVVGGVDGTILRDMLIIGDLSLAEGQRHELIDSRVSGEVILGQEAIVEGNRLGAIRLQGDNSRVSNNTLYGSGRIIEIESTEVFGITYGHFNLIDGNTLYREGAGEAIVLRTNGNLVRNNTIISVGPGSEPVIAVYGTGNTLDGNISPPRSTGNVASIGIWFHRDGNYFGDNRIASDTPFYLGGTVQTNWGGNRGY
jgi:hypothetical protein